MNHDSDPHWNGIGGCLLTKPPANVAKRATKHQLASGQLNVLLRLLEGQCILCLRCHAMVVDTTTRTAERRPRGLLCRFCKQRVAFYEGAYGHDAWPYLGCRCRSSRDVEWEPRIIAATAQYLDRTAPLESCRTNPARFEALIRDVSSHGADPHHVWSGAPISDLPQLPTRDAPLHYDYGGGLPLARARCANNCQEHSEHIYIACFAEPTMLRDSDADGIAVLHYVGWTRQQPPVRRVNQHGAICRESLVAIIPGTEDEEASMKDSERCPKCAEPLRYHGSRPPRA